MGYNDHGKRIGESLAKILEEVVALKEQSGEKQEFGLPEPLRRHLDQLSEKADSSATAAFTNVVTGLGIKVAYPSLDVRYHQIQIQEPPHFNHRNVSEKIVYPFLRDNDFHGAKSGWQTRTLERPKPYILSYDENIKAVKKEFLAVYHAIEEGGADASRVLAYLFQDQIIRRDERTIDLVKPKIDDIATIVDLFEMHFSSSYKGSGASRLPVLALHSLYSVIMPELKRFDGLGLAQLQLHSAADSQTGAVGDIEIKSEDGAVFEALEVKHNIPITLELVADSVKKLTQNQVDRYYILTTSKSCVPSGEIQERIKEIKERTGCQIIVNGVIPTIRYYLRLVESPRAIFEFYVQHLNLEKAIGHEHRARWNQIVLKG